LFQPAGAAPRLELPRDILRRSKPPATGHPVRVAISMPDHNPGSQR
jgi:hypothetical protein